MEGNRGKGGIDNGKVRENECPLTFPPVSKVIGVDRSDDVALLSHHQHVCHVILMFFACNKQLLWQCK